MKIQPNAWGNDRILYHKTNKEASTVLCSVVKHLGSGRVLKKWGKTLDFVSCFPLHFFRADVTKTGNGEWGMGNGEWGMGNGNGEWEIENGKWEIENGKLIFFYINVFIMWNKFF